MKGTNTPRKTLRICWGNIRQRCYNPNSPVFKYYGGRGISLCKRWHSFEVFLSDMMPTWVRGLEIERVNNDLGYEPSNCRWATRQDQLLNRRKWTCKPRTAEHTASLSSALTARWARMTPDERKALTDKQQIARNKTMAKKKANQ